MNRETKSQCVLGPRPFGKEDEGVEPGHALDPFLQQPHNVYCVLSQPIGAGEEPALTESSVCLAL